MNKKSIDWAEPLIQAKKQCQSLTDLMNDGKLEEAEKACDSLIVNAHEIRSFIADKRGVAAQNGLLSESGK